MIKPYLFLILKQSFLVAIILFEQSYAIALPAEIERGSICIGRDLSPTSQSKEEIYIHIGNYKPIAFYQSMGKTVLSDIDLNKRYLVKLVSKGKQFASWWLDFKKLNTKTVMIWKAYGAWKMKAISITECPNQKFSNQKFSEPMLSK